MNKKFIFILLVLLVGVFFILAFRGAIKKIEEKKQQQVSNEKLFELILFAPVPTGVTNIQGLGFQENSLETYLKFSATPDVVARLMSLHEYKKGDCNNASVFQSLFVPSGEVSFRKWNIEKSSDTSVCYTSLIFNETGIEGKFYSNNLRQRARSEFLFDEQTGVVYFHEQGI